MVLVFPAHWPLPVLTVCPGTLLVNCPPVADGALCFLARARPASSLWILPSLLAPHENYSFSLPLRLQRRLGFPLAPRNTALLTPGRSSQRCITLHPSSQAAVLRARSLRFIGDEAGNGAGARSEATLLGHHMQGEGRRIVHWSQWVITG